MPRSYVPEKGVNVHDWRSRTLWEVVRQWNIELDAAVGVCAGNGSHVAALVEALDRAEEVDDGNSMDEVYAAERLEEWAGSMHTHIRQYFGWRDRLRILVTGRADVYLTILCTESPGEVFSGSRARAWRVRDRFVPPLLRALARLPGAPSWWDGRTVAAVEVP